MKNEVIFKIYTYFEDLKCNLEQIYSPQFSNLNIHTDIKWLS